MTFNEKAILLYEYIVGVVPTTEGKLMYHLRATHGIHAGDTDYEPVFVEYNINYLTRSTGKRGRGQHLGKYKKGYRNNRGQMYEITLQVIAEYMNNYKRTGMNLEQFLSARFDVHQTPPQTVCAPPQQAYTQPQDDSSAPCTSTFNFSSFITKAIPIAVIVLVLIVGYNLLFGNKNDGTPEAEESRPKPAITTAIPNYGNTAFGSPLSEDGTVLFGLVVSFNGEESDMLGIEDYYLCLGNEDNVTKLNIGRTTSGDTNVEPGSVYKLWVKSGDMKSDVWSVEVGGIGGTIYFDCTVGQNGCPELVFTQALGEGLSATIVE